MNDRGRSGSMVEQRWVRELWERRDQDYDEYLFRFLWDRLAPPPHQRFCATEIFFLDKRAVLGIRSDSRSSALVLERAWVSSSESLV